ncbi:MAG: hypothetical protein KGN16_03990 [Burkholderiales bacterium]|nr:hypothetical protein [Burkholderiales bacterium]
MSDSAPLLDPLRKVLRAFFVHDVALRRVDDKGMRLVLEQRDGSPVAPPRPPTREEIAARRENEEFALLRQQLTELLDDLPTTRRTMRHLVFVEHALAKKGLRAFDRLPVDVLQGALEQLETLVTNWSPVGLAALRSKMAVAIIDREHMDPEVEPEPWRTAVVFDGGAGTHPSEPELDPVSDDDALAAAYAALGTAAPPAEVQVQGEIGSRGAVAAARDAIRQAARVAPVEVDISLDEPH